ncbi:hypothetical protein ACQP2F_13680 [Actinoplanes sp. CA-030573]|uniref:hypothetical protein n=1 Tax=Actinoplanes sp. CA-030573 TaxID=3239898 RepID=UPI003D913C32
MNRRHRTAAPEKGHTRGDEQLILAGVAVIVTATGLPICRHVYLGAGLTEIDARLREIGDELAAAYPPELALAAYPAQARTTLRHLRTVLDAIASREHAHRDGWSTTVYHSVNPARRAEKLAPIVQRHQSGNPPCCSW